MTIAKIKNYLPHRYPFLLVDGVTQIIPGKEIVGFKYTTINEMYFQGHFPEEPIVPGVLLIESLAQLTAIMYGCTAKEETSEEDLSQHVGYLVGVEKFRFHRLVGPGECMILFAKIKEELGNVLKVKVYIKVENRLVADGIITVTRRF